MSSPVFVSESFYSLDLDRHAAEGLGRSLNPAYAAGSPYPHAVIDDFLDPEVLDGVLRDLDAMTVPVEEGYSRPQENKKYSFNPSKLPTDTRHLFGYFNSQPFVSFIEGLTGIRGLIPDPSFLGGGVHEVRNGGHLSIHADFNFHPGLKLERRVNVLIYLNRDWQPDFGGQFEFWNEGMTTRTAAFDPIFNRCVVFNTTSNSYHGNPNPVQHPQGIARRSIALYYYTATWDATQREHTTQFKARPQSEDRVDWSIKVKETARDLMPPMIWRALSKSKRRAGA